MSKDFFMENMEFIQQHLIEKGVPKDLTKLNASLWSKLISTENKPLAFQSPVKVFFKEGVVFGLVWGLLMWLVLWRIIQLISTICFGSFNRRRIIIQCHKSTQKIG